MITRSISLSLIIGSANLHANQSLGLLQNKIETYVLNKLTDYTEGKIQVSANKMDSRLNLRECSEDKLEIFNPYDTPMLKTTTMGIKCLEESNHWTLYVPIKITVLKTVLVTKHAIRQGEKLSSDDFYQAEFDAQRLQQGYFTNEKQLLGLVCKRDISADTPLTPYNVALEKIVLRGQEVSIVAKSGALMVSMDGVAMSDGVLGDVIKVKNSTSKRIIEAQVAGEKRVEVTL